MAKHNDGLDAIQRPVRMATARFQEILETFRGQVQPRPQDNPIRQWMREHRVTRKDLQSRA